MIASQLGLQRLVLNRLSFRLEQLLFKKLQRRLLKWLLKFLLRAKRARSASLAGRVPPKALHRPAAVAY